MRFLLLNQTFYPDVVATSQYLTEVARALADEGHEVTVIAGRRGYDNPEQLYPARESWHGIDIRRACSTRFGKGAKWKRAVDFASFIVACCWHLLWVRRPDVVVALTSPPLISFIGAWYARLRRARFVYWVMDLNPDEAIAAGWLREGSLAARVLDSMSRFSLRRADPVVVLDRFMHQRVAAKLPKPAELGGQAFDSEKAGKTNIVVLPPWSHDAEIRFDAVGRERFRAKHGLTGKFLVMYSGNHSPVHPLTNLLHAARELATDDRIAFCFVGGGSEFPKVKAFAGEHRLRNIVCLPYQPFSELAGSLSAADLHVVVMGDPFVGTIHPCKVYNILSVAAPILYIGPEESHVSEILREVKDTNVGWCVRHGDIPATVAAIHAAMGAPRPSAGVYRAVSVRFSQTTLLPQFLKALKGR